MFRRLVLFTVCLAWGSARGDLVAGPEIDAAPVRLGEPVTGSAITNIVSSSNGFLVGVLAGGVSLAIPLDSAGRPLRETLMPSPAGLAVALASDGQRYLAVDTTPPLFDGIRTFVSDLVITLLDDAGFPVQDPLIVGGVSSA